MCGLAVQTAHDVVANKDALCGTTKDALEREHWVRAFWVLGVIDFTMSLVTGRSMVSECQLSSHSNADVTDHFSLQLQRRVP